MYEMKVQFANKNVAPCGIQSASPQLVLNIIKSQLVT